METLWQQKERDEETIKNLADGAEIDELFATILVNRNIKTLDQLNDYLNPKLKNMHDPSLLHDMEKAVERIQRAIEDDEKIYVYGDYDVDGVTGTSVIYECLKVLGADVHFYIPHRLKEGYGLNVEAIQHIIDEKASLVVTVDCGIRGFEAIEYAQQRHLDIIVTDHHEVDPDNLPKAYAIVNPKDQRGSYPFKGICGASVAFKLSWALCQAYSPGCEDKVKPELRKFLLDAMALVAIGTVADVVPLREENRVVTHFGLIALERSENVGLKALKEVANLSQASPITPEHVGFRLGPRINAMGRMEHSRYSVELLTTKSISTAQKLARSMEVENQKRRKLQQRIFKQAMAQMERYEYHKNNVIVLADEGWHPGIIGIVASRIVEKYYRPVCIIGVENGYGKSSARSIPGFNLFQALKHCEELLVAFGGHSMAAGFKIEQDKIPAFRRKLNEFAQEILTPEHFIPSLQIDLEITLDKIDWEFAGNIRKMSPLGEKNPPPVLIASDLEVVMNPAPTRAGGKGEHLIFYVKQNDTSSYAVFFGQGERLLELIESKKCDLAFSPTINTWGENHNIELMVKDMKTTAQKQGF